MNNIRTSWLKHRLTNSKNNPNNKQQNEMQQTQKRGTTWLHSCAHKCMQYPYPPVCIGCVSPPLEQCAMVGHAEHRWWPAPLSVWLSERLRRTGSGQPDRTRWARPDTGQWGFSSITPPARVGLKNTARGPPFIHICAFFEWLYYTWDQNGWSLEALRFCTGVTLTS